MKGILTDITNFLPGNVKVVIHGENKRTKLIHYLFEVVHDFEYKPETYILSVIILDKFSSGKVFTTEYQLVGITSLFIAAKVEECSLQPVSSYSSVTDSAYSTKEILEMEVRILSDLNFSVHFVMPYHFFIYNTYCYVPPIFSNEIIQEQEAIKDSYDHECDRFNNESKEIRSVGNLSNKRTNFISENSNKNRWNILSDQGANVNKKMNGETKKRQYAAGADHNNNSFREEIGKRVYSASNGENIPTLNNDIKGIKGGIRTRVHSASIEKYINNINQRNNMTQNILRKRVNTAIPPRTDSIVDLNIILEQEVMRKRVHNVNGGICHDIMNQSIKLAHDSIRNRVHTASSIGTQYETRTKINNNTNLQNFDVDEESTDCLCSPTLKQECEILPFPVNVSKSILQLNGRTLNEKEGLNKMFFQGNIDHSKYNIRAYNYTKNPLEMLDSEQKRKLYGTSNDICYETGQCGYLKKNDVDSEQKRKLYGTSNDICYETEQCGYLKKNDVINGDISKNNLKNTNNIYKDPVSIIEFSKGKSDRQYIQGQNNVYKQEDCICFSCKGEECVVNCNCDQVCNDCFYENCDAGNSTFIEFHENNCDSRQLNELNGNCKLNFQEHNNDTSKTKVDFFKQNPYSLDYTWDNNYRSALNNQCYSNQKIQSHQSFKMNRNTIMAPYNTKTPALSSSSTLKSIMNSNLHENNKEKPVENNQEYKEQVKIKEKYVYNKKESVENFINQNNIANSKEHNIIKENVLVNTNMEANCSKKNKVILKEIDKNTGKWKNLINVEKRIDLKVTVMLYCMCFLMEKECLNMYNIYLTAERMAEGILKNGVTAEMEFYFKFNKKVLNSLKKINK